MGQYPNGKIPGCWGTKSTIKLYKQTTNLQNSKLKPESTSDFEHLLFCIILVSKKLADWSGFSVTQMPQST